MTVGHINGDKRKNIIILGSGRSGTSMVAGLFARSGYFMGKNLYPGRDSNPKGFFEDSEINSINEDILSLVQPGWAHPGQQWLSCLPLSISFPKTTALDRRIQDIVRLEPFCLKDPRFSYTLPVWRPFLKKTVCICVFRDPASTIQSILKECNKYYPALPMNQEIALQVWAFMYQHIESSHRHQDEWVFVHYDQIFDTSVQAKLERITGAPIDGSFPDRTLRRSEPGVALPDAINALYRNLCELAEFSPAHTAPLTHTAAFDADRLYENMLANTRQTTTTTSDFSIAISAFLAQHPNHARAHNDIGVLLYQQGAKQEAVRHYELAVQFSPDSVTFLRNLADYYYVESGDINKALWMYNRILTLLPNDVETLANLGSIYVALQQPQNALNFLQKALIIDPQNQKVSEIFDRIRPPAGEDRINTPGNDKTCLSSHEQTWRAAKLFQEPKQIGKLVMTLLVRDEEDIIGKNIEFHFNQGVDFIIVTDNGSVDRTKEILNAYSKQGKVFLIEEPSQDYAQAVWVNRMTKIAVDKYQATYVFHCDADEFWCASSGNLKTEITSSKENVLFVPLINVLLRSRSKQEHFPEDSVYAVIDPMVTRNLELDSKNENIYLFEYPPKVMFKTADGLFEVVQGNHNVVDTDSVRKGKSMDIRIYHFPVRSYQHFQQKVINGGSSYERNLQLGKSIGFHWRNWFDSYKKGTFDQEYNLLILDDRQAEKLKGLGIVEPFNFSALYEKEEVWGCRSVWRYDRQDLPLPFPKY
jgi:tetratricopeptide (TPR) repeat protein